MTMMARPAPTARVSTALHRTPRSPALLLLLLVWAAGTVLLMRNAVVDRAVEARDMATLRHVGISGHDALRLAAEDALLGGRVAAAGDLARAALARAPLDRRAIRTLAMVAERQGDSRRAVTLMNRAAQLSWQDMPTQLWLLRRAAAQGDVEGAVQRADAILRTDHYLAQMLLAMTGLAQLPRGRDFVIQALADRPPWRASYLDSLTATSADRASADIALIDGLRTSAAPPTERELGHLLHVLTDAGYGAAASAVWTRIGGGSGTSIDDPDFARAGPLFQEPLARSPFAWSSTMQANVTALPGTLPNGRPALLVTDNGGGADEVVSRLLALTPGRYRLHYQVETSGSGQGSGVDRLAGRVECWPSRDDLMAPQPWRSAPSGGGTAVEVDRAFAVPPGCDVQRLVFASRAVEPETDAGYALRAVHVIASATRP